MLQIIHDLMTKQHTVCINTIIFNCLITNSTRTRDAKYSLPILVTRLCKNFLPDDVFDSYDQVFVAPELATSTYNSCLYAVWTPSVQPEYFQTESSSEELLEEMMNLLFGSSPRPLILEPSCLPYGKVWRKFLRARLGWGSRWRSRPLVWNELRRVCRGHSRPVQAPRLV